MKRLNLAIITALLIATMAQELKAEERGMNGLLIGAGSGALVGQAIGRDAEATLIGTAVGGVLGFMVGNEMDRTGYERGYEVTRAGMYYPPPPMPSVVFSYRPDYDDRRHHRRHYRNVEVCRDVVTVERRHGRYREVTRTVCRERDGWRGDHRGDWRGDRYDRSRW